MSREMKDVVPEANRDVDWILDNLVGGGHWWQWRTTMLLHTLMWTTGYVIFIHLFAAYEPPHRCRVPSCDTPTSVLHENHTDYSLPVEHATGHLFKSADKFDPCSRYNFTDDFAAQLSKLSSPLAAAAAAANASSSELTCSATHFQNATQDCEDWVYDRSIFTNSITMDLNLVCEGGENKQHFLGTLLMLGFLVGSFIGGRLGDKFGRKPVMFAATAIMVPAVACAGIYPNYALYATLRFVSATMIPIIWVTTSAYNLEICSPAPRRVVIACKELPFKMFVFNLIIYCVRDWQMIHYWTALACATGLPAYFWIPESPRWLLVHGKKEEAVKVFKDIARTNRRTLTEENIKEIRDIIDRVEEKCNKDSNLTPLAMFRKAMLFKSLVIIFCWVMIIIGYYGLLLNSAKLAGDPILNFFLTFIPDLPLGIFLFFTINRLGRRWMTVGVFLTLGLSCIAIAFIPKDQTIVILILFLIGRTGGSAGIQMVWLYTSELYPTNLRTQAIGTCSMIARVFSLSAPFIGSLAKVWQPLPLLALGLPICLAGILAGFLPETKGRTLPQTLTQADRLFAGVKEPHDFGHLPRLLTSDSISAHIH